MNQFTGISFRFVMMTMLIMLIGACAPAFGQDVIPFRGEEIRDFFPETIVPTTPAAVIPKRRGRYTANDWAELIDQTWGPGLPTEEKLRIFDLFWSTIDKSFACFNDVVVDWDSLRAAFRPEIEAGVSRGRFAAIMKHLAMSLKESHTVVRDKVVEKSFSSMARGIPLLYVGTWGYQSQFGAGLTPLPDSSLLVYQAVSNHPLNLVPGDIVLGYDGVPWKRLYKELIDAQFPIVGTWWGSSDRAFTHSWLVGAGMNWYLFDTLDVIKYASGDTLHLSTDPMVGRSSYIFCTEQMDIPGVPKPEYAGGKYVSYGIIEGSRIGYIYGWGWSDNAETEFYEAVRALMFDHETDGMIIDFRMNYGGNMFLSNKGLALLFNTTVRTIDWAIRCNTVDRLLMCPKNYPEYYDIVGDPATYYDKPIAMLTGPGAISSGDQVALRMTFHPRVRVFGKPTTAAFNAPTTLDLGDAEWSCRYAPSDAYLVSNPGQQLTHVGFPVDEDVWLTPDDVAKGFDTVVESAIAWIMSQVSGVEMREPTGIPGGFDLAQNYPNPFHATTTIPYELYDAGRVTLTVYDVFGREVVSLVDKYENRGGKSVVWNGTNSLGEEVRPGMYFYRIQAGKNSRSFKMLLTK
ncbi:MAG: S41 family peptidase [Bacteroidota bacterium]|jgi:hypothetical protein